MKRTLEAVSTIGQVIVALNPESNDSSDALCGTTNHKIDITFIQAHGPLPLIQVQPSSIDVLITVTEKVQGNKEVIECSGRGICNYLIGICTCVAGYGSSDGMGNPGTIGDCGNILKDTP